MPLSDVNHPPREHTHPGLGAAEVDAGRHLAPRVVAAVPEDLMRPRALQLVVRERPDKPSRRAVDPHCHAGGLEQVEGDERGGAERVGSVLLQTHNGTGVGRIAALDFSGVRVAHRHRNGLLARNRDGDRRNLRNSPDERGLPRPPVALGVEPVQVEPRGHLVA